MSNLPSERLAIVATIDPANYSSGTNLSDAIDMDDHDNVMFILLGGKFDNGKSGTIDFKVKESDASGGTYHKISGKSITQFTEAGSACENSQAIINVNASELSAGHRFLKASMIVGGTNAVVAGALALGSNTRFSDALTSTSYGDLSTVVEIVA
jgi:hypothetical protein